MIHEFGCEFCGDEKAKLEEAEVEEGWMLCRKCSKEFWERVNKDIPIMEIYPWSVTQ